MWFDRLDKKNFTLFFSKSFVGALAFLFVFNLALATEDLKDEEEKIEEENGEVTKLEINEKDNEESKEEEVEKVENNSEFTLSEDKDSKAENLKDNLKIEKEKLVGDVVEDVEEKDEPACILGEREGLEGIRINEIYPFPLENEEENREDWVELFNSSEEKVDIGGCCLVDGRYHPEDNNLEKCFIIEDGIEIEGKKFKVFEKSEFKFDINNKSSDGIYFLDSEGNLIDESFYSGKSKQGMSYALNEKGKWLWTALETFGAENQFEKYSDKIELTEILPNAEGKDNGKEWVEILNNDDEEVDFKNWTLLNQSGKIFALDGLKILPKERLKIEIVETSFSLRNSEGSLAIINPNGEEVDRVNYLESAKEGASYNKNQQGSWEWSIFVTPGRENRFNNLPSYRVKIPDEIYENVKAELEIIEVKDKDNEKLKYRWDFGDNHRSYLKETTHTFTEKGRYTIQTRVSDLSADVFKELKISVKKFPEFDLRIIEILPNPSGSDSENEKIWIENLEDEKINLKGWIIATGKNSSSLTNHYFKDDFKIKAGDIEAVGREDCPFSLLNKKGRVVLKSPDGSVIDKVKYEKENLTAGEAGIEEDEVYLLEDGNWLWKKPIKPNEVKVLGENNLIEKEEVSGDDFLNVWSLVLDNSRLGKTNRGRAIFFESWLLGQSKNYFFRFIFPEYLQ